MPAPLRHLRPLAFVALAGTVALGVAACGSGPRKSSSTTIDAVIFTRGVVVGGKGDQSTGVRALNAKGPRTLGSLQTDFRSPLFGDGGQNKLTGYVNGLLPDPGAVQEHKPGEKAEYYSTAYPGDRVGWLVRDVSDAAPAPSAVVGLYPAPFSTRFTPKRRLLPLRIQCADVRSDACNETQAAFTKLGLNSSSSNLEDTAGIDVVRVYVGSWPALRPAFARGRLSAAIKIEQAAESNGYGLQISPDGKAIREGAKFGEAANPQTYGAGTGLLFAIRDAVGAPAWILTGTDDAGATKAALGLNGATLAGRIAAVIPPN